MIHDILYIYIFLNVIYDIQYEMIFEKGFWIKRDSGLVRVSVWIVLTSCCLWICLVRE